jgi:tRNA(Leu) C34 or U34 (ribose-2'-O)-methylase TrmL|tara:strand:+ start:1102 stop:1332 length:231 start_codon:yes stop_codon:yes gene_type:complete
MLKNLEDVKLFIEWCKEHKVKSFKIDGVQFELSELSFVESVTDYTEKLQTVADESKFEEEQQKKEDDELMFWSSNI